VATTVVTTATQVRQNMGAIYALCPETKKKSQSAVLNTVFGVCQILLASKCYRTFKKRNRGGGST